MIAQIKLLLFICACAAGMVMALILHWYQAVRGDVEVIYLTRPLPVDNDIAYLKWLNGNNLKRKHLWDKESVVYYDENKKFNFEFDVLAKKISVLCLILAENKKFVKAVNATWAAKCNDHYFVGHFRNNLKLRTLIPSGKSSFSICCSALHTVAGRFRNKFDWILIVDSRSFVIVENLRYFATQFNSTDVHYLGHAFRDDFTKTIYNLGGAGTLLSNGALNYFHETVPSSCQSEFINDMYDIAFGRIFKRINVLPIDTRDLVGCNRFNVFSMEKMLVPGSIDASSPYWKNTVYLPGIAGQCCSDTAITFNMSIDRMHFTYYLVYRLHALNQGSGKGNINPEISRKLQIIHEKESNNSMIGDIQDEGARKILSGYESLRKRKYKKLS
ncbi:Uncharacterised protein g4179 [Pycnogonum litorale]